MRSFALLCASFGYIRIAKTCSKSRRRYVPWCVPPSPHPHADMTDPHGDGGHVGGAELPDAGPEASRCTVCKHARSPRGTDLSRGSLRPARQRRKPQGAAEAQRTPASATPEPTQRRRNPRARAQRDGQIAFRHATHPAAALQVAVLEAGGEGRTGQLAPELLPASAHTTHRGRGRGPRTAENEAKSEGGCTTQTQGSTPRHRRARRVRRGASTGGPFARAHGSREQPHAAADGRG